MATYAIGDTHGCFLTLMALLEKLGVTDKDTLIFDGDLVDRGRRIKELLDWVFARKEKDPNKTIIVLGNHDISFIDWFNPGGQMRNAFMYHQGLSDTLYQLGGEAAAQPYAAKLWEYGVFVARVEGVDKYVFCHADYNWEGENFEFDPMQHCWNRIDKYSHGAYNGPIIVHGHTPCRNDKIHEIRPDGFQFGLNLDGGCCYTNDVYKGCLRALNVHTGEIIEQESLDHV